MVVDGDVDGDGDVNQLDWLEPIGRVGNNYRFRWQLPREEFRYTTWSAMHFSLRFSTDGATWKRVARDDGAART